MFTVYSLFQHLNFREQEENNHAEACDVISCTWVRNYNVLMCLPATNKSWEWGIDFLHAVVGPGLSKKTSQSPQCGNAVWIYPNKRKARIAQPAQ